MIAASDPQEFIPSGRQQALRHPGPLEVISNRGTTADDFLLDRLEKVSLSEAGLTEWWTVRKSPNYQTSNNEGSDEYHQLNKSGIRGHTNRFSTNHNDSNFEAPVLSSNASQKATKLVSDANTSKYLRFSNESDVSKSSCNTNRSFASVSSGGRKTGKIKSKLDIGFTEEELYVKGNIVIWSRGLLNNSELDSTRKTICSYSSYFPIKHALWCTFYCERPNFDSDSDVQNGTDKPSGKPLPSVCIVDTKNIRVFTTDNEDFITSVPFPIGKIWSTKFGLLLEKEQSDSVKDSNLNIDATLFSLIHPLEDVCPVAIHYCNTMHLIENYNQRVVYTNEEPSIGMMYDEITGQHSVYQIRKLKSNEWIEIPEKNSNATPMTNSISGKLRSLSSVWDYPKVNVQNATQNSRPASVTSLYNLQQSRVASPMAAISRCQSPATSPLVLSNHSWYLHPTKHFVSNHNIDINSVQPESAQMEQSVIYCYSKPVLCFEHLWTDNINLMSEGAAMGPATKVFLIDDLTGKWFLCYLVPSHSHLFIVSVDFANTLTFGRVIGISAKDAIPIPHLHMLAIMEHNRNIVLYSGTTIVGKLHIGGVLVQHTPSPYVRRNILQFNSPFPRRSSLLPTCGTPMLEPVFDEHLLSPVLPDVPTTRNPNIVHVTNSYNYSSDKVLLNGLRDAIEDRITLQYLDGTYYRIKLPPMTSSVLIENCLNALRQALPRDAAITLLTRWYSTRNSPGPVDLNQEWNLFTSLLLDLLGYGENSVSENVANDPVTPLVAKRQKQSTFSSDKDWHLLMKTKTHDCVSNELSHVLNLDSKITRKKEVDNKIEMQINTNAVFFTYIKVIHFTLHLLYEDLKLNLFYNEDLPLLAALLCKLASDLNLINYVVYYWKDFPTVCKLKCSNSITGASLKSVICWNVMNEAPYSIMQHIYDMLGEVDVKPFPYLANVNSRTKDVVQLCGVLIKLTKNPSSTIALDSLIHTVVPPGSKYDMPRRKFVLNNRPVAENIVLLMTEMGITTRVLDTFPTGIKLLLQDPLWRCRENPPNDWNVNAYNLLWRYDLSAQAKTFEEAQQSCDFGNNQNTCNGNQLPEILPAIKQVDSDEDGMEEIDSPLLKMRFPEDHRVMETRRLLQSSKPVPIILVQRPDVSDHDFIEEQEKHLYAICTRTMALPVGRGMFTLRTLTPVITEPLPSPPLCLTGKSPPRGTTVDLTHIDIPANVNLWPLFHNGVANGLRIVPDANNIDSTWIIFNKPKSTESHMEHAGFLMALGFNGHLKNLHVLSTYDYLSKVQEMTSVGILLGLSAAFRGTCHSSLTKMLSIHVETLLPPTSMELDVPQNLQVAALLGIGLVYQGSSHRRMIEALLTEIGRPPGPEMENSVDRESYSLAAGLALGLVTLKQGGRTSGLVDLNVPDTLHYYMVGGNKRPLTGSQKDKYKVPSFQIREGSTVNLDVTAPGSTLALGLMYLGSGNKAIADWMAPPETQYLLDFIKPDFLMLRIISRSLIMWDDIEPTKEWIENQIPDTIRPFCMVKPSPMQDIDYEAMNQAYCNIITGACFSIGLKYAGSADEEAFETLLHYCHMFTSLTAKSIAELAGKPTIETCLNVVLLSASMVMAGTGNLDIMRLVRHLRRRVGVASSSVVTYGSHLAIHMCLGLLFLGGGRYTLSNNPASIAALICAFFPKFPTHSNDNRYHLQAFRHLYVLAVEPRLIIPRDSALSQMCYCTLKVVRLDGISSYIKCPGLISDLQTLSKVMVDDERYWPVVFERGHNWQQLINILKTSGYVDVKQRAGCLSYLEDKLGYRSQLARTLTQSGTLPWVPPSKAIISFTSDCTIRYFCDHYLSSGSEHCSDSEMLLKQTLIKATYECVIKDKIVVLPILISFVKLIQDLQVSTNTLQLWQFKIACLQILKASFSTQLISTETILALQQQLVNVIDNWENEVNDALKAFVCNQNFDLNEDTFKKLATYITFYDIPFNLNVAGNDTFEFLCKMHSCNFSPNTLNKLLRLFNFQM